MPNLSALLLYVQIFRQTIFEMLTPLQIVSLVMATGITTTAWERRKFLKLSRQIFENTQWVEEFKAHGGSITVIGKDLQDFDHAIKRWDYSWCGDDMRLLIMIRHSLSSTEECHAKYRPLLNSIDGRWTLKAGSKKILGNDSRGSSNIIIIFTPFFARINLDLGWSNKILLNFVDGLQIDDLQKFPGSLENLRSLTWYSNIHEQFSVVRVTRRSSKTVRGSAKVRIRNGMRDMFVIATDECPARTYISAAK